MKDKSLDIRIQQMLNAKQWKKKVKRQQEIVSFDDLDEAEKAEVEKTEKDDEQADS